MNPDNYIVVTNGAARHLMSVKCSQEEKRIEVTRGDATGVCPNDHLSVMKHIPDNLTIRQIRALQIGLQITHWAETGEWIWDPSHFTEDLPTRRVT